MVGRKRVARAALAAVLITAGISGLSACTTVSCPSWASFSDPEGAYRDASVVFIGTVEGRDGTADTEFGTARAYTVAIERIVKGQENVEQDHGTVRLAALPDSCGGSGPGYEGGIDQLEDADRVLVYASDVHGALAPLAPGQGVVSFPAGARLPAFH